MTFPPGVWAEPTVHCPKPRSFVIHSSNLFDWISPSPLPSLPLHDLFDILPENISILVFNQRISGTLDLIGGWIDRPANWVAAPISCWDRPSNPGIRRWGGGVPWLKANALPDPGAERPVSSPTLYPLNLKSKFEKCVLLDFWHWWGGKNKGTKWKQKMAFQFKNKFTNKWLA